MGLTKVMAVLLLAAATAHTFTISADRNGLAPLADYSAPVIGVIKNISQMIGDLSPITIRHLNLNLTELLAAVPNATNYVRGTIELNDVEIAATHTSLNPHHVKVALNGIVQPIPVEVVVNVTDINIKGNYKMDILLFRILPVSGDGQFSIGPITVDVGLVDTALKAPLGGKKMHFSKFDFVLNVNIPIQFDGLIGDEEFSKEINKMVNDIVNVYLNEWVNDNHEAARATVHDLANKIVEPITYADLLELLKLISS